MKRAAVAIALTLSLSTPSAAFTGAEFLQSHPDFASGFAWGILTYRTGVLVPADEVAAQQREMDCFMNGKITSTQLHAAVDRYIRDTPSALVEPALGAVIRTIIAICPPL